MTQRNEASFSRQMRKATRDVHKISDMLVNAKLAFDDAVWADGLLIFYEIFKYLEEHVPVELLPQEFHRKTAFENDLSYYLGPDWKQTYQPRKAVQNYIEHLHKISITKPILLLAYVYHLYMGLLSGGQILQKKRSFAKKINLLSSGRDVNPGYEVTLFPNTTVTELKEKMRELVDDKSKELDEQTKELLLEESRKVFELNNEIIKTVKGVNQVNLRKISLIAVLFVFTILLYKSLLK